MTSLDLAVFHAIHDLGTADALMRALSAFFATYLLVAVVLVMAIVLVRVWRDQAARLVMMAAYLRALTAAVLGIVGNKVIAHFFFRPRPFVTLGFVPVIAESPLSKSFPSDHATIAFALAASFAFTWPDRKWQLFAIATLIAVGRVMAGVHYPTDILAGAFVGTCWAWLVEIVDVKGGGAFSLRIARILTRHHA